MSESVRNVSTKLPATGQLMSDFKSMRSVSRYAFPLGANICLCIKCHPQSRRVKMFTSQPHRLSRPHARLSLARILCWAVRKWDTSGVKLLFDSSAAWATSFTQSHCSLFLPDVWTHNSNTTQTRVSNGQVILTLTAFSSSSEARIIHRIPHKQLIHR